MDPRTPGVGVHWSIFTGEALKVAKILMKLKFTEEDAKSIIGNGLEISEELEHLDDGM